MGKPVQSVSALLLLALWGLPAAAADLSKVDRTIAREPAYRSRPKYCLLVFGPEARKRVWLVLDGDVLYVDRNGNGDLTEKGKRVPVPAFARSDDPLLRGERRIGAGDIDEGRLRHTGLTITQTQYRRDFRARSPEEKELEEQIRKLPDGILTEVRISVELRLGGDGKDPRTRRVPQRAASDRRGFLAFAEHPQDAPVIHFNGPLRIGFWPLGRAPDDLPRLVRGKADEVRACILTDGVGAGSSACLFFDRVPGLVPGDVHPVLDIEFPTNPAAKDRRKARVPLTHRC